MNNPAIEVSGLTNPASWRLGQNILPQIAGVQFSSKCAGMWSECETPRLLLPLALDDDKDLLHRIIDQNEQDFFRILKERYPEDKDISSCFTSACTLLPPHDLTTNAVLDQWVGNMLTLLENGKFSKDQQLQIVARHKTSSQSRKSAWHQRIHRLIHPPDKNDKDEPRPLALYIERVISALQVEIQRVLDIRQLGYEVSIKDFHKPATITREPGKNAIGGGK